LQANPRLGQWLSIGADGRVTVRSGKVEIGQGIRTALAQIVAQVLEVDPSRVQMVSADTAVSPNEGVTAGSLSITDSGGALRQVCAQARQIYLDAAARQFGLAKQQRALLQVRDGQIGLPDFPALTSYWQLADPDLLDRPAGEPVPNSMAAEREASVNIGRVDLPAKVLGRPSFVHDMVLPGLLHGAVVQAPSPGANLLDVDLRAAQDLPGVVAVVRSGSFLGLVAGTEYQALLAHKRLAGLARWQEESGLPEMQAVAEYLHQGPVDSTPRVSPWRSRSGAIPRACSTCVPIWPPCWACRARQCGCAMPTVPAATATTVPMMWPVMPPCWRTRCRDGRCGCNGAARMKWSVRRWARPWWPICRPISTPRAASAAGSIRSGQPATACDLAEVRSLCCALRA